MVTPKTALPLAALSFVFSESISASESRNKPYLFFSSAASEYYILVSVG